MLADLLLARRSVDFAVCYLAEMAKLEGLRLLVKPLDELAQVLAREAYALSLVRVDTLDLWIAYTLLAARERTGNRRITCGWMARQLQRLLQADREERRAKTGAVKLWAILAGLYENKPQGLMYRGALRMLTRRAPVAILGPDGARLYGDTAPIVLPAAPLPPETWARIAERHRALRQPPQRPLDLALDPQDSLLLLQLLEGLQRLRQRSAPAPGGWEELDLRASCPECHKSLQVERLRLPGGDRLRLPPHDHPRPDHCGQSCARGALTLTLMPDLSTTNHALEGRPC